MEITDRFTSEFYLAVSTNSILEVQIFINSFIGCAGYAPSRSGRPSFTQKSPKDNLNHFLGTRTTSEAIQVHDSSPHSQRLYRGIEVVLGKRSTISHPEPRLAEAAEASNQEFRRRKRSHRELLVCRLLSLRGELENPDATFRWP